MKSVLVLYLFLLNVLQLHSYIANFENKEMQNSDNFLVDPEYRKLPTHKELQEMISSADSYALLKLIELISSGKENVSCGKMVFYSDEVLGILRKVLQNKITIFNQLDEFLKESNKKVKVMEENSLKLMQQIEGYQIPKQQHNLEESIFDLKKKYDESSFLKEQINAKNAQIGVLEEQIFHFEKKEMKEKGKINENQIILVEVNLQIKKLQEQLLQLASKKEEILKNIQNSEEKINQIVLIIANSRTEIMFIEEQLKDIHKKFNQISKLTITQEVSIERLRENLTKAKKNEEVLLKEIELYEKGKRMIKNFDSNEKKKDQLESIIQRLKSYQLDLLHQNQEFYYDCFSTSQQNYAISKQNGLFQVDGNYLPSFLSHIYGSSISLPSPSPNLKKKFNYLNLFQKFGSFFNDKNYFTCLQQSRSMSGNGLIKEIKENRIIISDLNGNEKILKIGQCSRIETNGQLVKGKTIYFKGVEEEKEINLYLASCL